MEGTNTIGFNKELLDEFPQLREKRSKFAYEMKYFRDPLDFEKLLKELKENPKMLPVIMWFYEEK